MKKIELNDEHREDYTQSRLSKISIKEIMDKYPDKVVDVYGEGKDAVLVLNTCRIKFTNTKITRGKWNGNTKTNREINEN